MHPHSARVASIGVTGLFCVVIATALFAQRGQTPPPAGQGAAGQGAGQGTAPQAGRGQGRGGGGGGPITLHAARVLDGKGGVIENGVVTVQGTKIVSVAPAKAGRRTRTTSPARRSCRA